MSSPPPTYDYDEDVEYSEPVNAAEDESAQVDSSGYVEAEVDMSSVADNNSEDAEAAGASDVYASSPAPATPGEMLLPDYQDLAISPNALPAVESSCSSSSESDSDSDIDAHGSASDAEVASASTDAADASAAGASAGAPARRHRRRDVLYHRAAAAPHDEEFVYAPSSRVRVGPGSRRHRHQPASATAGNRGRSRARAEDPAAVDAAHARNFVADFNGIPGVLEPLPSTVSDYTPLSFELDGVPVLTALPASPATAAAAAVRSPAHVADLAALTARLRALGIEAEAESVCAGAGAAMTWGTSWAHAAAPGSGWAELASASAAAAAAAAGGPEAATAAAALADISAPPVSLQDWLRAQQAARAACAVEQLLLADGWHAPRDPGFDRLFYSTISPHVLPRPPRLFVDAVRAGGPDFECAVPGGAPPRWCPVSGQHYYAPPHPMFDPALGAAPATVLAMGDVAAVRRLAEIAAAGQQASNEAVRLQWLEDKARTEAAAAADAELAATDAAAAAVAEEGEGSAAAVGALAARTAAAAVAADAADVAHSAGAQRERAMVAAEDAAIAMLQSLRLPAEDEDNAGPLGIDGAAAARLLAWLRGAGLVRGRRERGFEASVPRMTDIHAPAAETPEGVFADEATLAEQQQVAFRLPRGGPRPVEERVAPYFRSSQPALCYFNLPVIMPFPFRTGLLPDKDVVLTPGTRVAGRYLVVREIATAAFSRAVEVVDTLTEQTLCLKVMRNEKDLIDRALDEVKVLQLLNTHDPRDLFHVIRMRSCFYVQEHMCIATELLGLDLHAAAQIAWDPESPSKAAELDGSFYFSLRAVRKVARQLLVALWYLRCFGVLHGDIKPENVLIEDWARVRVKLIDFGSTCFAHDSMTPYAQSRSYRAPEVILGLPYDTPSALDMWSLGCVLCELFTGQLLFSSRSLPVILARMQSLLGPLPPAMVEASRFAPRYFRVVPVGKGRLFQLYQRRTVTTPDESRNRDYEANRAADEEVPEGELVPLAADEEVDLGFDAVDAPEEDAEEDADTDIDADAKDDDGGSGKKAKKAAYGGSKKAACRSATVADDEAVAPWQRPGAGLHAASEARSEMVRGAVGVTYRNSEREEPRWVELDAVVGARADEPEATPRGAPNAEEAFLDSRQSSLLQLVLGAARRQRAMAVEAGALALERTQEELQQLAAQQEAERKGGDAAAIAAAGAAARQGKGGWDAADLADKCLDPAWALATCHPSRWPGRRLRPQPWERDTPRRVHEFMMRRAKTAGVEGTTDAAFAGNPAAPRPQFFGAQHPAGQPAHESPALFANFLSQLLRYDPLERPTPEQALLHPFLWPVHDDEEWDL